MREDLSGLGHTFRSESQAEIALHGFEQWGKAVALKLRGPFVFAVQDSRQGALFIARDRIGLKPMFYAHLKPGSPEEALLFASEVKSFLADPAFERRVSILALNHYLTYQYVPHPLSIFSGAAKLPPGHWLTYQDGKVTIERYWQLRYEPKRELAEDDAVAEALAQVDDAVRVRLAGEGSIGCHLSGGIDSSTIVALVRRHVSGELKTFSIGFREQAFDELPYARQVAQQFSTRHREVVVEPSALECLGDLAWFFDEPMADSSGIPTYYLCKVTAEQADIALNGDGGDESFAGYRRYGGFNAHSRYRMIPRPLRVVADGAFALLTRLFPESGKAERLFYGNRTTLMGAEQLYTQWLVVFREYQKRCLLAATHRPLLQQAEADSEKMTTDLMRLVPGRAWIDRMTFSDISLYLPGALIPKVERMFSAFCLDGRAPFLDQQVMEFAAQLPAHLRFKNGTLKYLLKKAVRQFFPEEFLNRPKQGFAVPIGDWVRGKLRPLAEEFLLSRQAVSRGFFDPAYVRCMLDQHIRHSQDHASRIWALMILEAWCRTFLDREHPLAGPLTFKQPMCRDVPQVLWGVIPRIRIKQHTLVRKRSAAARKRLRASRSRRQSRDRSSLSKRCPPLSAANAARRRSRRPP
ncbi:MAG: asparagine synthase (glutamine-hydrolyzing) [candidate division NC10 bacterium]|nr:asparagine synthase (glutamine-hydrolyzing) [candidate division NC10 bacterium]